MWQTELSDPERQASVTERGCHCQRLIHHRQGLTRSKQRLMGLTPPSAATNFRPSLKIRPLVKLSGKFTCRENGRRVVTRKILVPTTIMSPVKACSIDIQAGAWWAGHPTFTTQCRRPYERCHLDPVPTSTRSSLKQESTVTRRSRESFIS